MKILNAEQIKAWDRFTIQNEPIASIDLMERAAAACCNWLSENNYLQPKYHFMIFCGKGNNGGDGLALARMLLNQHYRTTVYILEFGNKGTEDFQTNLERLHHFKADIHFIQSEKNFPALSNDDIVIDALIGSGLNRPADGLTAKLIEHINRSGGTIISVDIPSGLPADKSAKGSTIIKAMHTLSFQCYKPAFLVAENKNCIGRVHILDIGLHSGFIENPPAQYQMIDDELIKNIYKPRNRFSHKGNFGHAALITGSTGMMGAAVLCAKGCLRSGVGKLTCYIPKTGYHILQASVPEAMVRISGSADIIEDYHPAAAHEATGLGPGIGLDKSMATLLQTVFEKTTSPLVIDADALTILSKNEKLFSTIPANSILTPHPKEFDRLFGESDNDFARIESAIKNAGKLHCYVLLKGHYTFIAMPDGNGYFNSTGNAGMATAGSGDVLTGIITGLLAQGYSCADALLLAVYLHGLAGDMAAEKYSQEAMLAGDIAGFLGEAFKRVAE